MIIIPDYIIILILAIIFLPYSIYCTIGGFRIIKGVKNIILLHYKFLFFLLQLIRGKDYMSARKMKFINTAEYKRQGWYAFVGGILLIIGFLLYTFDALLRILAY